MKYSVVIPFHNEEHSVVGLWEALLPVLKGLGPAEAVLVDDASTDGTLRELQALRVDTVSLRVLSLETRRGLSGALQAGFDEARGGIFVTLDGDLQNDPADIPLLLEKLERGFDLVAGWRRIRRDGAARKFTSRIANGLQRLLLGVRIHDVGCNLRVLRRAVLGKIRLGSGLHRYLAVLAEREGFRVGEMPVLHHPRRFGRSKFRFGSRIFQGIADFFRVRFGFFGGIPGK